MDAANVCGRRERIGTRKAEFKHSHLKLLKYENGIHGNQSFQHIHFYKYV